MKRVVCTVLLSAIGLTGGVIRAAEPTASGSSSSAAVKAENVQPAYTLPHKEYKISFNGMGVIREVKVKEGDVVKKGDVMMVQNDLEERQQLLAIDAAVMASEKAIEGAVAKAGHAEVVFEAKKRLQQAQQDNDLEFKEAKASWDIAKVQVDVSKAELEQKKAERGRQAIRIKHMTLEAPADGVVQQLVNDIGSNVDPTKPVIVVVQNDPMVIEVQVPALQSLQVKKGDKMRASYDRKEWREAAVSFLSPQADAGSGMRIMRLEMPNPNNDPSGLQIFVELPDKLVAAAAAGQ